MNPAVSIIMPVFNAEKYVKQAITSILDQSFTNFEFIIINDGSTDSSLNIIQNIHDPRIVLTNQNNKGVAHALNTGIKYSRGNYIARMDADDISEKHRLTTQFDYLNKNPNTALIGSNAIIIDMLGKYVYTSDILCAWTDIKASIPFFSIYHSSVMYRRDLVIKAGLYDEWVGDLNAFEDQLLWNRLINYGIIENLKEPLIRYRLQPDAVTSKSSDEGLLTQKIIPELVSGRYPKEEIGTLQEVKKLMTLRGKYYNYHSYVAKKYLFEAGKRFDAFKHILNALWYKPYGFKVFYFVLLFFLPHSLLKKFKKRKSLKID